MLIRLMQRKASERKEAALADRMDECMQSMSVVVI